MRHGWTLLPWARISAEKAEEEKAEEEDRARISAQLRQTAGGKKGLEEFLVQKPLSALEERNLDSVSLNFQRGIKSALGFWILIGQKVLKNFINRKYFEVLQAKSLYLK